MSGPLFDLAGEEQMAALAREFSLFARPGMFICLHGDLGAGKSVFARAMIRALAGREDLEVPSPTFTLVQPYDETRIAVWHVDLYRLGAADDVLELGLFDDAGERVTLVEWPDRLGAEVPKRRIDVFIEGSGQVRTVSFAGKGGEAATVARFMAVRAFVDKSGWGGASRSFLQGDASARRYERLEGPDGRRAILMDMPPKSGGKAVSGGKSYSEIAHLAQGTREVEAVNGGLAERGLSAPQVLAADHHAGLMIIEDLGDAVFGALMARGEDMAQPLHEAVNVLVEMTKCSWPDRVRLADGSIVAIAGYDTQALKIEVSLLPDWFWPMVRGGEMNQDVRAAFFAAWREVFGLFEKSRDVWVLRDYHSPNLIWLPERKGVKRVGLIDTQDCVLGHPAYDLVSLLQDARKDLPAGSEDELFDYYCNERAGRGFDRAAFAAAYAGLGAQRATKILGIFARLCKRDGKPQYLQHVPRVSAALERNLQHPALAPVKSWYDTYLPADERQVNKRTV